MLLELEPRNFDRIVEIVTQFNTLITKERLEQSFVSNVSSGNHSVFVWGDDGYAFIPKARMQGHIDSLIAIVDGV